MIKVAIIGASYLQLPLEEKAKSLGYETHCFAWESEDSICKKSVDFIGSHLVQLSTGYDFLKNTLNVALGKAIESFVKKHEKAVCVKKHSFLRPAVKIAGYTTVGCNFFLGINATILNNLMISDSVLIEAGTLVNRSITKEETYVVIPAKLNI